MEPLTLPAAAQPAAVQPEPGLPVQPQPQPQPELVGAPEMPPPDPMAAVTAAVDLVLGLPGQDAVRRVYQLSVSAAKAKAKLQAADDALDARAYHAALSQAPEVQYADVLLGARRSLDLLAQERRRLNLEAVQARDAGRPASIYEMQAASATAAMEQVAGGTLLFLMLPQNANAMQGTTSGSTPSTTQGITPGADATGNTGEI
jgi:hypothetical protein